jgi:ABC-type sugar transport system ATPase subunit
MTHAVEFGEITKTFGGTVALDRVSLEIRTGECHALMGENGAGKSTLGKVLAGIHRPDSGTLALSGRAVRFSGPREASRAGIGMVHQELAFCGDLTVGENLLLGRYPRRLRFFVDRKRLFTDAKALLRDIAPDIRVDVLMKDLSVAQHQMIQIAAAVGTGARILIFDEPTSALSEAESRRLFALIDRLRALGVTILYVSHRMSEVFQVCDRISVLRDGRLVGSVESKEASPEELIRMMIGRNLEEYFPGKVQPLPRTPLLHVEGLSSPHGFRDISFDVRAGEILGFAGLVGSGRSELARSLFGLDRDAAGTVIFRGRDITGASIRERMDLGIALVPEDRKRQGLALELSCRMNFSLTILDRLRRLLFLDAARERQELDTHFTRLNIKTPSYHAPASALSGGNQQKVVLAKWLARNAGLLILDEPTRGVDVGAKAAIHALIDDLASRGMGVILISSELPEVLHLSTRILVMRQGRLVGEVSRTDATQEMLLRMMSGLTG